MDVAESIDEAEKDKAKPHKVAQWQLHRDSKPISFAAVSYVSCSFTHQDRSLQNFPRLTQETGI